MSRPPGFKTSEETKAKLRATLKKLWQDSEYREHMANVHKGQYPSIETRAKISAGNKGKHLTEETKKKLRVANIGRHHTQETKNKIAAALTGRPSPMLGKHLSEEHKTKIAMAFKGRHFTEETRAKLSTALKGRCLSQEHKDNMSKVRKGVCHSEEDKAKMSIAMRKKWQDKEYAKKVLAYNKPNKAEFHLQGILNKHFPSDWKFVGDGQLIIGGRCPDFVNVNGKKELIELFGAHWHPIFDVAQRKEHYKQYGFRVAIIWEDELENEESLVKTLRRKLR